ncbi:NLR family CARD domain-containing protein 3 [Tachysurus fulvidraco]|uniref:NLR family CARD domain-containing protein 3 n=1 Tax=Tachysurus fulvidraco TaxID=1234273 RepID=UPI001FEDC850|nr:NLR family CARD domain-containing protein 3 [Tachysurus fulvidraco]XP_047661676.1 NLR family CARD domain-containing protein 3 [Tachysurus fulvidraco]XP_047661677.1 NLR family CARD domain-containing protein 3 [Tachysurus fulvidraco]
MDDEDAMSDNSVPFGYGASAYGSEGEEEEEDVAVHRESALRHMEWDTAAESYDVARAASPAPSYDSMCSDDGIGAQAESRCKIQLYRKDSSGSSCCSSSSDEKPNEEPKEEEMMQEIPTPSLKPELLIDPNEKRHPALTVDFAFKVLQSSLKQLREEHFMRFKRILWERYPEYFRDQLSNLDIIDLVDKMLEICGLEVSLKITLNVLLNDMKCKYIAEQLQGMCKRNEVRYELKKKLRRLYEHVSEDLSQQTLFEDVCTELYFTDGGNAAVNSEHEYRQIQELHEDARSKNNPLSLTDIFNPKDVERRHIRTVITKGSPGTGKSFLVQKFILDWVEGRSHQDIFFLLPLPFKELNQMTGETVSFMELICKLYPEMKEVDTLEFEGCQVMFICDGLDEYATPVNFRSTAYWCDHNEPANTNVLITNLIRGNMLYSAYMWVTSRPVAINQIPAECIHQLIEVRGFSHEQREAYFRKTIPDKELAERVVAYIKSCKTLYIMCYLPMFCTVVRKLLEKDLQSGERPKGLTQFYTKLLLLHINKRCQKLLSQDPEFFLKLGNMAFQLLEKGVFTIEKDLWDKFTLRAEDAVVTAGLCTQFYRETFMMYQEKVDCFIHPTVQDYLAALYVFLSFKKHKKNVLDSTKRKGFPVFKGDLELYKSAVDKVLHSNNGNYDLFLQFLLGMSKETNQELLSILSCNTKTKQEAREETAIYIKKMYREYPERKEYLQRCLDEVLSTSTTTLY